MDEDRRNCNDKNIDTQRYMDHQNRRSIENAGHLKEEESNNK